MFDLDGTLRDSRQAILPAIDYALNMHGIDAQNVDSRQYAHSIRAIHQNMAPHIAYDKFLASYDEKLRELRPTMVHYQGTKELVESLYEKKYRLGVVSSARSAQEAVDQYGLSPCFEVVVGGNDTKEHKPSPEPYMLALEKLAIPGEHVLAIGDLAADVVGAHGAGVAVTVGITHGFGNRQVLEEAGADYIIDSLAELPEILAIIEKDDGSQNR